MSTIALVRKDGSIGGHTCVDPEDHARFGNQPWRLCAGRYAGRIVNGVQIVLHREIMGLPRITGRPSGRSLEVDHINGDKLDNRRANLRIVSRAENRQNTPSLGGTSEHRGVCWDRRRRKWMAYGQLNGRLHNLGRFDDEGEAAAVAADWRAEHMPFSREALNAR